MVVDKMRGLNIVYMLLIIASLALSVHCQNKKPKNNPLLSCKDNNGDDVDWFVVHKLPKLKGADKTAPAGLETGATYRYILSPDTKTTSQNTLDWTKGIDIHLPSSMIGRTLLQAKETKETGDRVITIGYNDQPLQGKICSKYAHAKGTLMIDELTNSAVWLIHSLPKFPNIKKLRRGTFVYDEARKKYGQTFMCLSLDSNQLNTVGKHLCNMQANVYQSEPANQIPKLQEIANWLFQLINKNFVKEGNLFTIQTRKKVKFTLFSKTLANVNSADYYDLWSQIVAPGLKTNLQVQSWQRGRGEKLGKLTNKGFSADNIENLGMPWYMMINGKKQNNYKTTMDHSKWAIGTDKANVCVGDMNRKEIQKKRGGGAVCFSDENVWKNYNSMIVANLNPEPEKELTDDENEEVVEC